MGQYFENFKDALPDINISDFEDLCMGKGPQFAVHSVSFVPELTPADNDQIPVPDLDSLVICPWDKTCAWVLTNLTMFAQE